MDEVLQLDRWALTRPREPALLAPGQKTLTYGALLPLVRQGRKALRDAGLDEHEPVGVLMEPGLDSVVACLAVAGESACVPLDPSLTADEYVSYLKRLRIRTLVLPGNRQSPALDASRQLGLLVLRASLARSADAGRLTVETLLPRASGEPARRTSFPLLLLTSSTTGDPKLVPVSASNLAARFAYDGRALQLTPGDRLLNMMPVFHTFGLDRLLSQLHFGGSVACVPGFDPVLFASWWEQFRPTWLTGGVPVLHALIGSTAAAREALAGAPPRFVLVGAATPEPALCESVARIVHAPVLVGYGSSETGAVARTTLASAKPGSVGTSFGADIAIADLSGNLLPRCQKGEVLIRGAAVFSGYLDDEQASLQAFRNGWFRTGDLGHLDEEGFLFLTGRLKEIISRGSEKIQPTEIDTVLASHPSVQDAAAFAVPHRTLGEDVAAAVVIREGSQLTEAELRRYAAARLAAFKVPRSVLFLDSIPQTSAGKPKRALLAETFAEKYAAAAPRQRSTDAPLTSTEKRILRIWTNILGIDDISVTDDFIRLGGDSLAAARMLAEVDGEFDAGGRVTARTDFFDEPTAGVLARIVQECQAKPDSRQPSQAGILVLETSGASPESSVDTAAPLFCFPGWRGRDGGPVDPFYLRYLARSLGHRHPLRVVTASIPPFHEIPRRVEELARDSIQAIRGVQAHGPYLLGGHCLGAVVAFEAAQQLLAEGETVSRILFFDAVPPGYPKMAANGSKYRAEIFRIVRHLDWREAWSHADSMRRLLDQRVTGQLRRVGARFSLGSTVNAKMLRNRAAVALWQYTLRSCPVPLVHFIAADQPVSKVLDDPRYGWRDVAMAGIEFEIVPGDHDSMMSLANAPELAKRIHSSIENLSLVAAK